MITIREWMNDKTILITGGAGFFGKVLIEKLLRSCPGVKRIYLIIRPKGGKTSQERWADIIKNELFKELLASAPDITDQKVTVLDGDLSSVNIGLSQPTIEELKNSVNIIFHSAATVRFNDPLDKALLTNTRGTLEMCKLASEMNYLEVFVHVSTTFCNHNLKKKYYKEEIHQPCQDWRTILNLVDKENPAILNTLSKKIIQDHPNTYTFTKSLSEKIVEEYSCKFPTVIARSPVVVGMICGPVPGWTDNLNGPLGFTTAVGKGVMRVTKMEPSIVLECMPVDIAINAIIICAWDKATRENKELSVYNCSEANFMHIELQHLISYGLAINEHECTLDNDIWYPFIITVRNNFFFHILFYLLHVIPAIFIDSILFLMKKERRLMKITIKMYQIIQAMETFTMNESRFNCENYKSLWGKLTQDEGEIFYVEVPADINATDKLLLIIHKGVKKYFLKENLEDNERHRMKLRRFYYLDRLVRGILISSLFITAYKFLNTVTYNYIL